MKHCLHNVWALGIVAMSLGCPRPPPPPPPPPAQPQIHVPAGCETDLTGSYVHATRPDWHYLATDDGRELVLQVRRSFPDAGVTAPDAGVALVLERTPRGFVGAVEAFAYPAAGVQCPVRFPTEITACPDGGIRLVSVEAIAVDQACELPSSDAGYVTQTHALLPLEEGPPPSPDGGTP